MSEPIPMKCLHLKHKNEPWTLELGDEKAVIRDASGQVRSEFAPGEAVQAFQMPSFSESIKHFRAPVDGELWHFDVAKPDLKQIQAYMERHLAAAGPEVVQAVRTRAIRDTLIGAACAVGGVALSVASYLNAANNPQGGRYTVTYGLVIFGLVMVGKGIYGFSQYGRLKRLAEAPDQRG